MNIIIILSPRLNKLKLCGKFFLYDRPRIKTDFAELPRHKKFYEGHEEADVMVENRWKTFINITPTTSVQSTAQRTKISDNVLPAPETVVSDIYARVALSDVRVTPRVSTLLSPNFRYTTNAQQLKWNHLIRLRHWNSVCSASLERTWHPFVRPLVSTEISGPFRGRHGRNCSANNKTRRIIIRTHCRGIVWIKVAGDRTYVLLTGWIYPWVIGVSSFISVEVVFVTNGSESVELF